MNALDTVIQIWWFIMGAVVGSFLNVVIHRLPRGESLIWPGSHCPRCGHPIRWFDNLPVLSWLILRGRCRDCGAPISVRYPLVEAISSLIVGSVAQLVNGGHWSKWLAGVAGMDHPAIVSLLQVICLSAFLLTVLVVAAINWDGNSVPLLVWTPCISVTILAYGFTSVWSVESDIPLLRESPLTLPFWADLLLATALGWGSDILNRRVQKRFNRTSHADFHSWEWTFATGIAAVVWPAPVGILLGALAIVLQGWVSSAKFRGSRKSTRSQAKRARCIRGASLALWGLANWGLLFLV
ncbi:prepilin peptidase [Thermogutta sp.]|uniref:prepilin peptidase n=1 Tax=Thermogutta sp. TaxID=1962930 RepID=UPI003220A0B7